MEVATRPFGSGSLFEGLRGAAAALLVLVATAGPARSEVVPLPGFDVGTGETSVSGLSSGGYMAVQFEVAFSSSVKGAGVIAGGPYFCAQGDAIRATTVCSCTLFCPTVGETDTAALIRATDRNAARGAVDPTANLARHRIWLFSGAFDTIVPRPVMDELERYYRHYVGGSDVFYEKGLEAGHGQPTADFGNPWCGAEADPFINRCGYDAAGELLRWIYGPLDPPNTGRLGGEFVRFDQTPFLADPTAHGLDTTGWLYVPAACRAGARCRLHVAFHGCRQAQGFAPAPGLPAYGTTFVRHAGYAEWADTNGIIVLYPQAAPAPSEGNPLGCWDWWGYDDPDYALKRGRQMAAVKGMVDRIAGGVASGPPPAGGAGR